MRVTTRIMLVLSVLLIALPIAAQTTTTYTDPTNSFSMPVPDGWEIQENDGYVLVTSPEGDLKLYFLTLPTDDLVQAILDGWAIVDPSIDTTYKPEYATETAPAALLPGFEKGYDIIFQDGTTGRLVVGSSLLYQDTAYVVLFDTDLVAFQKRSAQATTIVSGFTAVGITQTSVADAEVQVWDDTLSAELDSFIDTVLTTADAPGVTVAIVQNGEIVYAKGVGKANEANDPLDADSRMLIASTTKSMTTLLMAQTVDADKMAWDTPVVEILPTFAVADPTITQQLTMQNLVCACTGVPRRDYELLFNADDTTQQDIVESLQTFEFFTDFGEAFQYSNQMVATAGFVTAIANGTPYADLYNGYTQLMQDNVFQPIGMTRATFDIDAVVAEGNYAAPYGVGFTGTLPLTIETEKWVSDVAPAGGAWASVNDLAQYLLFELNKGVTADGTRLVSEENLLYTWQPQIEIDSSTQYGLGWILSDYKGVQLISHDGNALGYTSGLMFAPDKGFGVAVLTNQQASSVPSLVMGRVLELIFDTENNTTINLEAIEKSRAESREQIEKEFASTFDTIELASYVGLYTNDVLGDVTLALDGETLVFDTGEFKSTVWLRTEDNAEAKTHYLLGEPPLAGLELFFEEADGKQTIRFGQGVVEYIFVKQS